MIRSRATTLGLARLCFCPGAGRAVPIGPNAMRLLSLLCLLALPALAGWRPFSADSPWNTPIPAGAPTDPASAGLIDDLASRGAWRVNIRDWSIPVYFIDAEKTPRHDVADSRPGVYGAGFGFPRRIPIPDGAAASPPVGEESDNHLCLIDRARGTAWDMWAARQDAAGRWRTGLGAVVDLHGSGVAPPWFDSPREFDAHRSRASGFPLIAGLIMVDEIKAGRIEHALCFAYDHCRTGLFVPPASTAQVAQLDAVDSRGIPMGGRIQLDPTWDVENSGLSPAGRVIARALQEYGAFCGDYAGANVLYAENSPAAVAAWQGVLSPRTSPRCSTRISSAGISASSPWATSCPDKTCAKDRPTCSPWKSADSPPASMPSTAPSDCRRKPRAAQRGGPIPTAPGSSSARVNWRARRKRRPSPRPNKSRCSHPTGRRPPGACCARRRFARLFSRVGSHRLPRTGAGCTEGTQQAGRVLVAGIELERAPGRSLRSRHVSLPGQHRGQRVGVFA